MKVQFHWDREGQKDANSSCWLRIASTWAGKNWGMIQIPRIGQEVLIDFLNGDPDAPIIIGSVYNPSCMPPYKLPDHKTRSGLRSRSTLSGGAENFNEVRFEDKKGQEQLFINAEKDLDLRAENDARRYIGKDDHLVVKGDQKEKIYGVTHRHMIGERATKIDGTDTLLIMQNRETKVTFTDILQAGMNLFIKAGINLIIESGVEITLKVGGNFIQLTPAGITIQGTMILINSGGAAGQGQDPQPKDPIVPDTADDGSKATKLS